VKGEPKVPIPTPASVSAPIPAPVRLVSMRTEDNAKVYAFETNDGLKANVYESKTGPNVVLEYFTPAGQRSLYLLTPDKILNPVDKTPVTPVSAVSDFHQAWRMQAGLTTSLK
jgi:alpha-D-ribose 1-methylphosphonate 5-phosphate C-P lyase